MPNMKKSKAARKLPLVAVSADQARLRSGFSRTLPPPLPGFGRPPPPPHRRLRVNPAAAAGERILPVLHPIATDRVCGKFRPALGPITELVAVPRWAQRERAQSELAPDLGGTLHELACGQRQRRHRMLHRGI